MSNISQYQTAFVAGVEVRMDSLGRISANDLHKASGGADKDLPKMFLRLNKTKDLVDQLVMSRVQICTLQQSRVQNPVLQVNNGNTEGQGTWMCEELAYSYIGWISPEFNAKAWTAVKHLIHGETEKATEALTGHKAYDNNLKLPDNIKEGLEIAITMGSFLESCGITGNQKALSIDKAGRRLTGVSMLEYTDNLHLAAPDKEKIFTPTQIGKELDPPMSAVKVNKTLQSLGYQIKIGSEWTATDKGLPFVEMLDTNKKHSDGTAVKQMKWKESIIDILKG